MALKEEDTQMQKGKDSRREAGHCSPIYGRTTHAKREGDRKEERDKDEFQWLYKSKEHKLRERIETSARKRKRASLKSEMKKIKKKKKERASSGYKRGRHPKWKRKGRTEGALKGIAAAVYRRGKSARRNILLSGFWVFEARTLPPKVLIAR